MEKNGKNDVGNFGFLRNEIFSKFFFLNWVKFDAESNGYGPESSNRHI